MLIKSRFPAARVHSSWIGSRDAAGSYDFQVIKAHSPSEIEGLEPDVILSSCRDIRAVAGSLIRMQWASDRIEVLQAFLDKYVTDFTFWSAKANLVTKYDDMLLDPESTIDGIAQVLSLTCPKSEIVEIRHLVSGMRPGSEEPTGDIESADPVTLLHHGHIGHVTDGAARTILSPRTAAWIEDRYGAWLVRHGFNLDAAADPV